MANEWSWGVAPSPHWAGHHSLLTTPLEWRQQPLCSLPTSQSTGTEAISPLGRICPQKSSPAGRGGSWSYIMFLALWHSIFFVLSHQQSSHTLIRKPQVYLHTFNDKLRWGIRALELLQKTRGHQWPPHPIHPSHITAPMPGTADKPPASRFKKRQWK